MNHATTAGPEVRRHARRRRAAPRAEARSAGLDWAAAGWAGLFAGLTMILLEVALGLLFAGASGTDPVRRIAAIALSQSVLPPLSPFTALVFFAAMSVHLPLSLLYARALAPFVQGRTLGRATAVGLAFGAGLYALNYYALAGLFPWFEAARGWVTFVSHLAFGGTAAGGYVLLAARRR
jgi:hypothetical protein